MKKFPKIVVVNNELFINQPDLIKWFKASAVQFRKLNALAQANVLEGLVLTLEDIHADSNYIQNA